MVGLCRLELQTSSVSRKRPKRTFPLRFSILGGLGNIAKAQIRHKLGNVSKIAAARIPETYPGNIIVLESNTCHVSHGCHGSGRLVLLHKKGKFPI